MSTIVTRAGKGSPLTNTELDSNFTNLNTDKLELSGGTLTGNLSLGDNVKAQFGNQSDGDLQIYSDGTNGVLKNTNGNYILLDSDNLAIRSQAGSNRVIVNSSGIDVTGSVTADEIKVGATDRIYLDGGSNTYIQESASDDLRFFVGGQQAVRVRTFGTDILGTVTADGLTVDRNGVQKRGIQWNRSGTIDAAINLDSDEIVKFDNFYNGRYQFRSGASGSEVLRLDIATGGDISFYEDTGTTPKLFWDASLERLGLRTSTPIDTLDIRSGGLRLYDNTDGNGGVISFGSSSGYQTIGGGSGSNDMHFRTYANHIFKTTTGASSTTDGTERLKINSTGIDVTGSVTADGLTVDGTLGDWSIDYQGVIQTFTRPSANYIKASHASGSLRLQTGGSYNRLAVASNGDISFYNDSAAQGLFWDSSTSRLGLGVTNPANKLEISGGNIRIINQSTGRITFNNGSTEAYFGFNGAGSSTLDSGSQPLQIQAQGSNYIQFDTNSAERLKINADGSSVFSGSVSASGKLSVSQSAAGFTGSLINTNSASDANGLIIQSGTQFSEYALKVTNTSGNTPFMQVRGDGAVQIPNGGLMVGSTTAPTGLLSFQTSTAGNNTTHNIIDATTDNPTYKAQINLIREGSSGQLGWAFLTNSVGSPTERLRISHDGSVGIGTNNPSQKLHVVGTSRPALFGSDTAVNIVKLYNSATGSGTYNGLDLLVNSTANSQINAYGMPLTFGTSASNGTNVTERMRISSDGSCRWTPDGTNHDMTLTSSGDLLVGKTSSAFGTAGVQASASNGLWSTRSNFPPLALNRLSSDGSIVDFYKDGTNVGSISTKDGDLNIGTGACGIRFNDGVNAVIPFSITNNFQVDNTLDLGYPTLRFKDLYLSNNATAQKLTLTKDPVGTYSIEVDGTNTGQPNLIVKQSTSERLRIDNQGRVGIGTSSPSYALHVATNAGFTAEFQNTAGANHRPVRWTDNTGASVGTLGADFTANEFILQAVNKPLVFGTGGDGAERMRIDSSGNVGIGASTVNISGFSKALTIDSSESGIELSSSGTIQALFAANTQGATVHGAGSSGIRMFTSASGSTTERARLTSGGDLLVGTTGANTYSSTVNTGVQIAPDFIGVARNQNTVMHLNRQGNDGTIVDFRTFGFVRGSVSISGSTTSYNTSSDERLKDNIKDSDDSGSKVDAIQVRQFDWKADGEHQDYGMVAQELLEVAPDAVTQGDTPDDMMGVDYSKLVPMLIKEIQSLRQRVAQLEE